MAVTQEEDAAPAAPPSRWLLDVTPLRTSPAYAKFWLGGIASGVGAQLTVVAVGVQVYAMTGSTGAVSLVGGVALVPMVLVGLLGGSVVDAFDRRKVLVAVATASWLCTAGIATAAWVGLHSVVPLYVLTALQATASTLVGIARFTVVPQVVPPRLIPAAASLSGVSAGLQVAVGPALGGVLVASVGFAWTYTADVVLYSTAMLGILALPAMPPAVRTRAGVRSVLAGARALSGIRPIRTAFWLLLVSMAFGRPQALYPALGHGLVGGGPVTVGLLGTFAACGAIASSVVSGRFATVRRRGAGMLRAVIGYGTAICALGVVVGTLGRTGSGTPGRADPRVLVAVAVVLVVVGFCDNASGIFRTTMLQTEVPDEVRGRVQGFFTVLLTAGPRLGDVYVGVVSTVADPWWAPLAGGALVVVLAGAIARHDPDFRHRLAPAPAATDRRMAA